MSTLREVYQFRLHQMSEKLELMKTDILNDYPAKKDTHRHMNPKHPTWLAYQELKRQASLCLTAIKIMKHSYKGAAFYSGKTPSKAAFRETLRDKRKTFTTHCPKGDLAKQNAFIFEAYYDLEQTEKDLKLNPSRFVEAEVYAKQRRLEASEAAARKKEAASATA